MYTNFHIWNQNYLQNSKQEKMHSFIIKNHVLVFQNILRTVDQYSSATLHWN